MLFETEADALAWYECRERVLTKEFLDAIPWHEVKDYGLDPSFVPVLSYMRDIEKATEIYFDELRKTPTWKDPYVRRFMERWVSEEPLHGELLDRFLEEAGHPSEDRWFENTRARTLAAAYRFNDILHRTIAFGLGRRFAGVHMTIVVVGAEVLSVRLDWQRRDTAVLFGDGAGACVMAPVTRGGILATDMGSDGSAAEFLYMPGGGSKHPPSHKSVDQRLHFLRMNGSEIFKLAVRRMADSAKRVVKQAHLKPKHIECFIPHQANTRIIEAVAKWAELPLEKVYMNLQRYGNTSAASNLIALYEAVQEGVVTRDDHVVMVAFGAGLTWGSILLQW